VIASASGADVQPMAGGTVAGRGRRARRPARAGALACALAAALGAGALPASADTSAAGTGSRASAGTVASHATPGRARKAWRLGQVELRACEVGAHHASGLATHAAYCAAFEVPEDWDQPAGRHIRLRVALVPSLAAEPDRDVAVFLDGGPGGAATEDYPAVAAALAPLRKRRHILLIDQRGTGASNPLDCGDALTLDVDAPAPASSAAQLARIRRCVAELAPKAAPQFYTTTDAVRDLEAVRSALGAPSLDLIGVSYGTRVAQQYAARYPQAVRSLVLDSPVPNELVLLSEHARNLEDAVQQRLARCRAEPACAHRFGDPYASLLQVRDRLRRQAPTVEMRDPQSFALVRRTLHADDLAALVRFYAYSATTSALLPYVISEARDGRFAPLLSQAQLVVGDLSGQLSGGMSASVLCAEDADLLQERPQDDATLLGGETVRAARLACAAWPHRPRPADFHRAFQTSAPVLVLGGEFDPVTPPRYGRQIVQALPRARLLLAPGQGHAVLGIGCMPKLVDGFLQSLDPAGLDDRCLRRLGETAFFVDANGAGP
jgi:pimeloyl-ACP methyl ester carboxylesterase